MAYVNNNQESPNVAMAQQNQNAPVSAGGAGVAGSTKAQNTPGQNIPAQPSAQLSAYLQANQPQAAQMAGNVANTVGQQVQAAGNAIAPAVNTYTGNLYSVPTNADVNKKVETAPSSLTPAEQETYKAELGAAGKAPNPTATFETTQSYADVTKGIQSAVEQANLWNSGNNVANLSTALQPFEGQNATTGDTTLDALLLSQVPGAYNQIQQAVAPAANFQNQLNAGATQADTALQNAIAQDTTASNTANQSAKQYATGLNNTLAGYLTQAQNDANAYNTSLNNLIGQEALVNPQSNALKDAIATYNSMLAAAENPSKPVNYSSANGIPTPTPSGNPADFSGLSDINFGNLASLPEVTGLPSVSELGTLQNYLDVAALQNLMGPSAFSGLNTAITPDTASQAGTYTPPTQNLPTLQDIYSLVFPQVESGLGANAKVIGTNPVLSQNALVNPYNAVQTNLDKLMTALNMQNHSPQPSKDVIAPQKGQPGNEAWFNFITSTYPGLEGFPKTYQEYLNSFNKTGPIRPI